MVYVQESEFEREFILGQYVVEMINRPPVFISDKMVVLPPSNFVLDENSLAQFSSTFSKVSPGRSYEMNQSMTAISHVNQPFGIQFIQSPLVYLDPVSSRLVMNFSTVKEFQVGNFTVIIRITDDGGILNGGINSLEFSLYVRVIAAPRPPFIVTPLNFVYSPRTSSISNSITTAFGFSLGRQLPYADGPFVTYSLSSCSNVSIFEDEPKFVYSSSGTLSDMNHTIRLMVTEHSASVVNLQFSLALYASGSTSCNLSVVDSTGNSSLFRVTFSIPYANRPPALIFPENGYSFIQRSFYRVSVNLFPSLNQLQQLENVVVTGPNGAFNSNLVRFGRDHGDFHFNHSDGRAIFGILHLSIYLQTNFPSTSFGSNNVSVSVTFNILRQNSPPLIALNSSHLYNPVITVVSTGLTQVLSDVITLVSIGDSESSQSLVSCNVGNLIDSQGLLAETPFVSVFGSVTLSPKPQVQGSIFFNVTCKDNGGIENEGLDTSNSLVVAIDVVLKNSPPVFVNLQNQVSFSQWNFEFGNVDDQSRKAFVFGQPLLSDDLVPQNPLSISLNQIYMVDSAHMLPDFQQSFDVSSLELSKLPFRIDDW
jgi:hypothetical protein